MEVSDREGTRQSQPPSPTPALSTGNKPAHRWPRHCGFLAVIKIIRVLERQTINLLRCYPRVGLWSGCKKLEVPCLPAWALWWFKTDALGGNWQCDSTSRMSPCCASCGQDPLSQPAPFPSFSFVNTTVLVTVCASHYSKGRSEHPSSHRRLYPTPNHPE
jgi:hypothetical protein